MMENFRCADRVAPWAASSTHARTATNQDRAFKSTEVTSPAVSVSLVNGTAISAALMAKCS